MLIAAFVPLWATATATATAKDIFNRSTFFSISHRLSVVGLRPSSSLPTGCVVSLRGDWAIFCHASSGRVGRVRSTGKNPLKCSAVAGIWTRNTERTDSEIHSLSYWAIMTRATGRTDSELSHWTIMTDLEHLSMYILLLSRWSVWETITIWTPWMHHQEWFELCRVRACIRIFTRSTLSLTRVSSIVSTLCYRIPTSVKGMQVPCRYPDQCQGYAGALQVSWPVSGVYRCLAGILTSVRGMQVPCRYPDQCQGYPGALQVSWPVSRVSRCLAGILNSCRGMQVPCWYPDQCQGCHEISSALTQCFQKCIVRGLSARTRILP